MHLRNCELIVDLASSPPQPPVTVIFLAQSVMAAVKRPKIAYDYVYRLFACAIITIVLLPWNSVNSQVVNDDST